MTHPADLDQWLDAQGLRSFDDTCVMALPDLRKFRPAPKDGETSLQRVGHSAFAQIVGQLRGSPLSQQQAHAQRLELSPVPFEGWVLRRSDDNALLACGQIAAEANMVGLYDVFTAPHARNQGHARALCAHLLDHARERRGAEIAYLQVESGNGPARALYHRLGFADAYTYHYRSSDPDAS